MKYRVISLVAFAIILFSCKKSIQPEVYIEYIEKGNDITNVAQVALLTKVAAAMQIGGPANAVEFCNLNASGIADSLNNLYNCSISRISAKNRNPGNALVSSSDKKLWSLFEKGLVADTVVRQNGRLFYYKPIRIAMQACLRCHGTRVQDIEPATQERLKLMYPEDRATGYALNDFRGLWKIEFSGQ